MVYTIDRKHRWIIAVYKDGEWYGTLCNEVTYRVKWFKSRENALKWIKKNSEGVRPEFELIPEIDDEKELTRIEP